MHWVFEHLPRSPIPLLIPECPVFFGGALLTASLAAAQTYNDIKDILQSYNKPKNIRLEISSYFWGEEYATGAEHPSCKGIVDRWFDQEKTILMVKWEGYNRNQQAPLDKMDKSAGGVDLDLKLLQFADGTYPVKQTPAAAPAGAPPPEQRQRQQQQQQEEEEGQDEAPDVVDKNG